MGQYEMTIERNAEKTVRGSTCASVWVCRAMTRIPSTKFLLNARKAKISPPFLFFKRILYNGTFVYAQRLEIFSVLTFAYSNPILI
jgi:hypothetical protein